MFAENHTHRYKDAKCAGVFTWPLCPLGADGPPYVSGPGVALRLRLIQGPLVHHGPEQVLLSQVGVDVLRHSNNIMSI